MITAGWSITPGGCPSQPTPQLTLGCSTGPCLGGAHSLQGRCCWRHRSQRHRCGQYRVAGGHRGCGRRSGRWCSGQRGPQQPLPQGTCLSPRSQSCSLWSGQSVRERKASTGMLCAKVIAKGFPPQGSRKLFCGQGDPTTRR